MMRPLLDQRYAVGKLLVQTTHEQHYEAYHVSLGIAVRLIAVPFPEDVQLADPKHFRRCATQAASLRHQALPRLRDFFSGESSPDAKPTYYAVFDPHEGVPFTAYLAQRRGRSLCEALIYALALCDALDMLGRQAPLLSPYIALSPDALRVRAFGRIGLAELGVAHWLLPTLGPRPTTPQESVYFAPEVLAGNAGDARARIYSVAGFLWHTLVGSPPARSLEATPAAMPEVLETSLRSALNPNPERRYQTLDDFGQALGQAALQVLPQAMTLTRQLQRIPEESLYQAPPLARHSPL